MDKQAMVKVQSVEFLNNLNLNQSNLVSSFYLQVSSHTFHEFSNSLASN